MIDVEAELKILENSVRDIIAFVLTKRFGPNWIDRLKISADFDDYIQIKYIVLPE